MGGTEISPGELNLVTAGLLRCKRTEISPGKLTLVTSGLWRCGGTEISPGKLTLATSGLWRCRGTEIAPGETELQGKQRLSNIQNMKDLEHVCLIEDSTLMFL